MFLNKLKNKNKFSLVMEGKEKTKSMKNSTFSDNKKKPCDKRKQTVHPINNQIKLLKRFSKRKNTK